MILEILSTIALVCAAIPSLLYCWNSLLFKHPPNFDSSNAVSPRISVLIPARNEERSIVACIDSVLASVGVIVEIIVLDDHSEDDTAKFVSAIAVQDHRVRIESAPALPEGWSGKQHACFALSKLAQYSTFAFLDADVRLQPDALARMVDFLKSSKAGLVSGFPRQITFTFMERLIIPLIHWLLLCYLPLIGMRRSNWAAFGAGCGQIFLTTREVYESVGGHAAVRESFHDGITLPRAYRRAGCHTDICDATSIASCRMYRTNAEVWFGFAKNAREGMASTIQLPIWTTILICGHILPLPLMIFAPIIGSISILLSFAPRLHAAFRYRESFLGAVLYPLGVLALLGIQWYAFFRAIIGNPVMWKGRTRPDRTS